MSLSDNNVVSLKRIKVLKKAITDLKVCLNIIDVNLKSLKPYLKYKPIAELYSILSTNYELIDNIISKYKREINEQEQKS